MLRTTELCFELIPLDDADCDGCPMRDMPRRRAGSRRLTVSCANV